MRSKELTRMRMGKTAAFSFALAIVLALSSALALPASAHADVRKADVVLGQTVDARGLSVAQCPSIDAQYAVVMDADGTVYFERNAGDPTQIASITKIMTAVVALDAVENGLVSLDDKVTVSAAAAAVGESSAGLQQGDTMDLATALKALLVPSGNDAAVAISEMVGQALLSSGAKLNAADGSAADESEEAFIAQMNATASTIGCTDTVYENPHGLDFDEYAGNLHSTASDVAKVVQYAMRNDVFRQDVALGDVDITVQREGTKTTVSLKTTDEFSFYSDYAIGVKTGFTDLAGASFAGATNKDGKDLYAIVIHSSSESQRFQDAATLTDWVYAHEKSYQLANSSQTTTMSVNGTATTVPVVAEVAHADWIDKTVKATFADPSQAVTIFDLNGNVSQSFSFDEVKGNVKAGQKIGTATFKQRNNVIATVDIVACEDVDAPGFIDSVGIWWDRLFRGFSGQPQVAASTTINETPLVNDKTALAA